MHIVMLTCLQAREGTSGASTPRSHVSSPWNTDASEGEDEGTSVLSAAAATRHALQAGTTATLSEGNQAKMREVGVSGEPLLLCEVEGSRLDESQGQRTVW